MHKVESTTTLEYINKTSNRIQNHLLSRSLNISIISQSLSDLEISYNNKLQ